ncbi:MAG: VTT domain-containing protein [Phormidesmis sp.]
MTKQTRRVVGFIVLIALVAVPIILLRQAGIGKAEIQAYVEQLGVWAPIGLFGLRFTSVLIPALPGTAYSVLAGGLLGFGKGLAVVCLSDFLSCTLSFWLASRYGRSLVSKLVGDRFMHRVDRFTQRHLERNFFLMTAFLMTGFFDFVAYGIGLARAPARKFLPALALSIAISNPPVVALGAGILAQGKLLLVFALLGVFALALLTGWLQGKKMNAAEVEVETR